MPLASLLLVCAIAAGSSQDIIGSCLRADPGVVSVGLREGGIATFDPVTGSRRFYAPSGEPGATIDLIWVGGRPWWIQEGQPKLYSLDLISMKPMGLPLQGGAIPDGLFRWKNSLILRTVAGYRYYDPTASTFRPLESALPPVVLKATMEGPTWFDWRGKQGLVVSARKGAARKLELGDTKPAFQTGLHCWTVDESGVAAYKGNHSGPLLPFLSDGTLAPGDFLRITAGGVLAVGERRAALIPWWDAQWSAADIAPAIAPRYPAAFIEGDGALYWVRGRNLYCSGWEDGTTDVYIAKRAGERLSGVAISQEAVWATGSQGLLSIRFGDPDPSPFLSYALDDAENKSRVEALKKAAAEAATELKQPTIEVFIKEVRRRLGLATPAKFDGLAEIEDLEPGDLVRSGSEPLLYVGEGEALRLADGKPTYIALDQLGDLRAFALDGMDETPVVEPEPDVAPHPGQLADLIRMVGVGKPNPRLGHGLYVRVDPSNPLDQPATPLQTRMQNIMEGWLGTPYRWGGESLNGTDCSGFVTSVYREIGIALPRHSQAIARVRFGRVVTDVLNYGDVLVFPRPRHVAIYAGGGRTVETLIRRGVGYSNVWRRDRAIVRRFLPG